MMPGDAMYRNPRDDDSRNHMWIGDVILYLLMWSLIIYGIVRLVRWCL